jgi:O-antigen chain-terminating methyltransferase
MAKTIHQIILDIPEVYQPIYGHPNLSQEISRACIDRLEKIIEVHDVLAAAIGRSLRVLDLGCAQGFFSLSLAARGATVHGVDLLDKNIAVCEALAEENSDLKATFEIGRLETVIVGLEQGQYDLILGLSVFHHIVHEHGIEQVRQWLTHAVQMTSVIVLELALNTEPLYWAISQPQNPLELLAGCVFVHEVGRFSTHLSSVVRPMIVVSNRYWVLGSHAEAFQSWSTEPHSLAHDTHQGSRRYYYGEHYFAKIYQFNSEGGAHNRAEFSKESTFLAAEHKGFRSPKLLTSGFNEREGWVVMDRLHGKLLLDALRDKDEIDAVAVLRSVLVQLVALESEGLYCNDVRTWNVMLLTDGSLQLIDFGSISPVPRDCVWPENIFLAFNIFVHELSTGQVDDPRPIRKFAISPYNLQEPFRSWAMALWRQSPSDWSFRRMLELLEDLPNLKPVDSTESAGDVWARAIESAMQAQKVVFQDLKSRLAMSEADKNRFADDNQRLVDDNKRLANEIESLRQAINQTSQLLSNEHERSLQLINELNAAKAKIDELNTITDGLNRELQAVFASRSWRLTVPLRKASLLMKHAKSRLSG